MFICVYFVCFCFILHTARWGGPDGIEVSSLGTYLSSLLRHCWLGHLTPKNPSPIWPIMCLVGR